MIEPLISNVAVFIGTKKNHISKQFLRSLCRIIIYAPICTGVYREYVLQIDVRNLVVGDVFRLKDSL